MTRQYPVFGEVVNGLMWDGTEWVPVPGLKAGDVINDHMWTGTDWVQMNPTPVPPQDKLWRKWWFWLMVTIIVLSGFAALDSDPAPPPPAQSQEAPKEPVEEEPDPEIPGLDDPVVDGDLEFTATDIDTGIDEIPGSFNQVHKPLGSYTFVKMDIRNVGDNPADFSFTNVEGTVDGDAKIPSDAVGSYYVNGNDQTSPFIRDLNPGARMEVTMVFDVPKDMALKTVIGHDSLYSDGAVITLP